MFGVVNPKRKPGTRPEVAPTALSGPLLSRFDIVLLLADRRDAEVDKLIAAHILDGHQKGDRGQQVMQVMLLYSSLLRIWPSLSQDVKFTSRHWDVDLLSPIAAGVVAGHAAEVHLLGAEQLRANAGADGGAAAGAVLPAAAAGGGPPQSPHHHPHARVPRAPIAGEPPFTPGCSQEH